MAATAGKVLISGSSGLVGSALLPRLTANGWQVTRLIRSDSAGPGQISWDPSRPIPPESVSGFDAVIHLAGETIAERWTARKKQAIRDSRVVGTRNIAEALAQAAKRPALLLAASAVGFYGDRGDEVLNEESLGGQGFLAEVCRDWESATQPAVQAGVRTVMTRFGIVLSPSGGALAKMLPPFRLGLGGRVGSGRQWWSWVALDDVIGAIEYAMKTSTLAGPLNVVSPNPVTNREFTTSLASALSRPALFPMPAFAARAALGQMADELLLASQRVEPAKLRASGYRFRRPDLDMALAAILKR
ncbi:MAG TPA: TIGR01777 family oxidoreductase [Terriglobales bacterium]|nr:TIGR01777 family oxidoreductase [Terriglobales bacterium]